MEKMPQKDTTLIHDPGYPGSFLLVSCLCYFLLSQLVLEAFWSECKQVALGGFVMDLGTLQSCWVRVWRPWGSRLYDGFVNLPTLFWS